MIKKLFALTLIVTAPNVFAESAIRFHNDLHTPVHSIEINDEGYEIKSHPIAPGDHEAFDIIQTPDEDQPLVREEKNQITEIRFSTGQGKHKNQYSCKLPQPSIPQTGQDIIIKASTCHIIPILKNM